MKIKTMKEFLAALDRKVTYDEAVAAIRCNGKKTLRKGKKTRMVDCDAKMELGTDEADHVPNEAQLYFEKFYCKACAFDSRKRAIDKFGDKARRVYYNPARDLLSRKVQQDENYAKADQWLDDAKAHWLTLEQLLEVPTDDLSVIMLGTGSQELLDKWTARIELYHASYAAWQQLLAEGYEQKNSGNEAFDAKKSEWPAHDLPGWDAYVKAHTAFMVECNPGKDITVDKMRVVYRPSHPVNVVKLWSTEARQYRFLLMDGYMSQAAVRVIWNEKVTVEVDKGNTYGSEDDFEEFLARNRYCLDHQIEHFTRVAANDEADEAARKQSFADEFDVEFAAIQAELDRKQEERDKKGAKNGGRRRKGGRRRDNWL